jgi:hypothetical protein
MQDDDNGAVTVGMTFVLNHPHVMSDVANPVVRRMSKGMRSDGSRSGGVGTDDGGSKGFNYCSSRMNAMHNELRFNRRRAIRRRRVRALSFFVFVSVLHLYGINPIHAAWVTGVAAIDC